MCQGEAPDVFGFDEDADQVVVLQEHPDESLRPQVEAAVQYCPAMALAIEEELRVTCPLTRAEIEEFWESWLDINREAERTGDWRVMAEWYAEDATYGWMYSPDEHFMAVGRDQIRDWAIGIEMDGLDGWHYDYQVTMIDEQERWCVGFWKQRSGIIDDATGEEYEILGIGGSWFGVERQVGGADDGRSSSPGSATGSTCRRPRTRSSRSSRPARRPTPCSSGCRSAASTCPGTTATQDIPSSVWPPPVERGDYVTQEARSAADDPATRRPSC